MQRRFRTQYGKQAPTRQSIYDWSKEFNESGSLQGEKSWGDHLYLRKRWLMFVKLTRAARRSRQHVQVPQKTVWNILRKRLRMFPYRLQLLQNLSENDKILHHSFCMDMQQRSEKSDHFFDRLIFGDELTFHISGTVNKHNVRIWGTENPESCSGTSEGFT
jgi:hypothetical protein